MFEKVLICYSESKDPKREFVEKLKTLLEKKYKVSNITVCKVEDTIDINEKFDIAFSIGGDGSMLRTLHLVPDSPVIGVNLGRKGFIANIEPFNLEEDIDKIFSGRYSVIRHSFITGMVNGEYQDAVNDITIGKKDFLKTVHLELYVNGSLVDSYICDGILVSTAFGSTAYNRALNNTIVHPSSPVYVITPIGTADSDFKSLIVHHDSDIKVRVIENAQNSDIVVGFDGTQKVIDLADGFEIEIGRSPVSYEIIQIRGYDYFKNLREKI